MEQVNPLLVQAQRKLHARIIDSGGPAPTQPHFQDVANDQPITAKKYISMQIKVELSGDYEPIDLGANIDPEGHDAYSGMFPFYFDITQINE